MGEKGSEGKDEVWSRGEEEGGDDGMGWGLARRGVGGGGWRRGAE